MEYQTADESLQNSAQKIMNIFREDPPKDGRICIEAASQLSKVSKYSIEDVLTENTDLERENSKSSQPSKDSEEYSIEDVLAGNPDEDKVGSPTYDSLGHFLAENSN